MDDSEKDLSLNELWQKYMDDCNDKQSTIMATMRADAKQLYDELNRYGMSDVTQLIGEMLTLMSKYENIASIKRCLLKLRKGNSKFFRN